MDEVPVYISNPCVSCKSINACGFFQLLLSGSLGDVPERALDRVSMHAQHRLVLYKVQGYFAYRGTSPTRKRQPP